MKLYNIELTDDKKVKFEGLLDVLELDIVLTVGLNSLMQAGVIMIEEAEQADDETAELDLNLEKMMQ